MATNSTTLRRRRQSIAVFDPMRNSQVRNSASGRQSGSACQALMNVSCVNSSASSCELTRRSMKRYKPVLVTPHELTEGVAVARLAQAHILAVRRLGMRHAGICRQLPVKRTRAGKVPCHGLGD